MCSVSSTAMLDRRAAIHYHRQARRVGDARRLPVDDAKLQPQRPGAGGRGRTRDSFNRVRSAEDVDYVKGAAGLDGRLQRRKCSSAEDFAGVWINWHAVVA